MINISPEASEALFNSQRAFKPAVIMHLLEPYSTLRGSVTASSQQVGYEAYQVLGGRLFPTEVNGVGDIPNDLKTKFRGWRSSNVSDSEGIMNEVLTVIYDKPVTATNFWLVSETGYFPVMFVVEGLINDVWEILDAPETHDRPLWTLRDDAGKTVKGIRVSITKNIIPGNEVRIKQFGAVGTLILDEDFIQDFDVLEEGNITNNLLTSVVSNELSLALKNDEGWFTAANSNGPFFKLFENAIKLECYIGIYLDENTVEYIPLGHYEVQNFSPGLSESMTANILAYDRLQSLGELDVPVLPIQENTTVGNLFKSLFEGIGLKPEEYMIDQSVNQQVAQGYLPGPKTKDALAALAEAGMCHVTIDRKNRVKVRSAVISLKDPLLSLTEEDMMINSANPYNYGDSFNTVEVAYHTPTLSDVSEVFKVSDLELFGGLNRFYTLEYSSQPVKQITSLQIDSNLKLEIANLELGANSLSLDLTNTEGAIGRCSITADGQAFDLPGTTIVKSNKKPEVQEKKLSLGNKLIQSRAAAEAYADWALNLASTVGNKIEGESRGIPQLELFDLFAIRDVINNVPESIVAITRHQMTYDGGFSAKIEALRPIEIWRTVFIKPGQIITMKQQLKDNTY